MSKSLPKWTDERTDNLVSFVGDETPVSQETVASAAESLETSTRSISSKLRKIGYDVELASANATRAYSDSQAETLAALVVDNSGVYTYAEIAANFEGGAFSPKSVQGKILSMELTEHVKAAPKPEVVRTFTPAQEATFIEMANANAFLEDIATAMGKEMNSVRGKALSLLRAELITAIPKQQFTKDSTRKDSLADLGDVSEMTVEAIAEAIGKTARGVKTMLTRRGITCENYDGAKRKAAAAK